MTRSNIVCTATRILAFVDVLKKRGKRKKRGNEKHYGQFEQLVSRLFPPIHPLKVHGETFSLGRRLRERSERMTDKQTTAFNSFQFLRFFHNCNFEIILLISSYSQLDLPTHFPSGAFLKPFLQFTEKDRKTPVLHISKICGSLLAFSVATITVTITIHSQCHNHDYYSYQRMNKGIMRR